MPCTFGPYTDLAGVFWELPRGSLGRQGLSDSEDSSLAPEEGVDRAVRTWTTGEGQIPDERTEDGIQEAI